MYSADCISAVKAKIKIKQSNYTVSCIHHVFCRWYDSKLYRNHTVLGLQDSMWSIILPNAISTFNLLVMKSFFAGLPEELEEAAAIDGMNTYQIFLKIIIPLSKPIIATMCLFYMVGMWNEWFTPMLYLDSKINGRSHCM